ncbi:hypothetical protein HKT18_05560 [Flavobacterium sp. IMCC34852]|uniref:histidine kinase n=1 Tax=Flavobacterium rivulicola TaxID=2732161 RepID=A0A7Y3R8U8_9FLAO|nr:tetratricopeptide repeat protein [Flavobacterium sp. IMCC34852]NNT71680.1 hypothetical protein [Flavobacterium sp. IMCC34852]
MILKRLIFPIFLFGMLMLSCDGGNTVVPNEEKESYSQLVEKAFLQSNAQKYDSAFYYFEKANGVATSKEQKAYALYQMAELQRFFCDFSGAETTATAAYENCDSPKYLPYVYNTLGIVYQELYNYDEAIKYFNKCYNDTLNEVNKCIVKNNISLVYLDKKDFKTAINILTPISQNDSLVNEKLVYAKVLDNLGYAYFKTNNPKAKDLLNQSLTIRDSLNNALELTSSLMHMAEYYQKSNTALAFDFAQRAYDAAQTVQSPDDKLEALKFMISTSEPGKVKALALQQIELSDSLTKVRQTAKNQFAKIKYDSQKALEEKEKYKTQKEWSIVIAMFVVLAFMGLIYFIRKRNKKRVLASVHETENRIAKKIHDELANDVFQTMTFAETQDLQNPEKKELLIENLDAIYGKARDISQTNSEIPTDERFGAVLLDLITGFNSEEVNIITKNSSAIDWGKINRESKNAVYRVIQELLVNMKKHSNADLVVLVFSNEPKNIAIKYTDNGKGLATAEINKKGLQNAENRIHAVKGTIIFDHEINKGFRVIIQIPK